MPSFDTRMSFKDLPVGYRVRPSTSSTIFCWTGLKFGTLLVQITGFTRRRPSPGVTKGAMHWFWSDDSGVCLVTQLFWSSVINISGDLFWKLLSLPFLLPLKRKFKNKTGTECRRQRLKLSTCRFNSFSEPNSNSMKGCVEPSGGVSLFFTRD